MHERHRQDRTDKQRTDSIGRTVLETVAKKTSVCLLRLLTLHTQTFFGWHISKPMQLHSKYWRISSSYNRVMCHTWRDCNWKRRQYSECNCIDLDICQPKNVCVCSLSIQDVWERSRNWNWSTHVAVRCHRNDWLTSLAMITNEHEMYRYTYIMSSLTNFPIWKQVTDNWRCADIGSFLDEISLVAYL